MENSEILLVNDESKGEEFNIVLQKREGHITKGTFKGTSKVYSRRNYIYS